LTITLPGHPFFAGYMISAPPGLLIANSPNKGHGHIITVTGWPGGRAVAVDNNGLLFSQAIHVIIAGAEGMEEVIAAFAIGVPRTDAGHHQIAALVGSPRG
jgi:hypothetical protein